MDATISGFCLDELVAIELLSGHNYEKDLSSSDKSFLDLFSSNLI